MLAAALPAGAALAVTAALPAGAALAVTAAPLAHSSSSSS